MGQELDTLHSVLVAAGVVVLEMVVEEAVEGPFRGMAPSGSGDHEEAFYAAVVVAVDGQNWGLDTACLGDPAGGWERLEEPG